MPATSTEDPGARNRERGANSHLLAAAPRPDLHSFLDELLAEQQRLQTPVAQFAAELGHSGAQLSALRSQLIPLSVPGPDEHYAFEVDLDACSGCKACVAGCHSLNGLDDHETWRDVGLVLGGGPRDAFQQTITSACHHCADPACANGCPVLAYEKDPVTGIVRHLDDQCIGCSYCVLKCPYDVPKFNARLGIVRKCDMCHGRLAAGEAPACVQACPTHAIRITKVARPHAPPERDPTTFLSVFPDPAYTRPTTRYISKRPFPADLRAADAASARLEPAHWPLVALVTFMSLAVGCSVMEAILAPPAPALAVLAWFAGATGLASSVLHLGQPQRAWRIFLGLRQSWLSREAVVFAAWFPLASAYTAARLGWSPAVAGPRQTTLALATAIAGAGGLLCSVMIYVDTRREFWRFASTAPRFFGSAALLGLAASLLLVPSWTLALAYTVVMFAKVSLELRAVRPLDLDDADNLAPSAAMKTARLLTGPLRRLFGFRILAGVVLAILPPLLLATPPQPRSMWWLLLILTLGGELAERYLFFRAVVAPRMPGMPAFRPVRNKPA